MIKHSTLAKADKGEKLLCLDDMQFVLKSENQERFVLTL